MRRRTFDAVATIAGLFLILSGLGFWHLRRAAPEAEVLPKLATHVGSHAA